MLELLILSICVLTHVNIIFEYYHASIILDNVAVMYLEDGDVCRSIMKKQFLYQGFNVGFKKRRYIYINYL